MKLQCNPKMPYKRNILSIKEVSSEELPFVFHTSDRSLKDDILDPQYCRSSDYIDENGKVVPVAFILPFPHGNRTPQSNLTYSHKKELEEKAGGVFYSYLTIGEGVQDKTRQDKTRQDKTKQDKTYLLFWQNLQPFVWQVLWKINSFLHFAILGRFFVYSLRN